MHTGRKTARLFDNEVLESLSRVHPVIPFLFWTPIIAWLFWRSFALHNLGLLGALAATGLLVWSLTEYTIHRFVFHLAPGSPRQRRVQFVVHGIHHEHPFDPMRLLIPPIPGALVASILYGLFRVVLGPACVDAFFAAFLAGYLVYDYTHLSLHHGIPRTRLGRYLRRHHMRHHFVTPDACWGVTSPLWDWVFRTMGERPASRNRIPVAG